MKLARACCLITIGLAAVWMAQAAGTSQTRTPRKVASMQPLVWRLNYPAETSTYLNGNLYSNGAVNSTTLSSADGAYAWVDLPPSTNNRNLYTVDYGFNIPDLANITGVTVTVVRYTNKSNSVIDSNERLLFDGFGTSNNPDPSATPVGAPYWSTTARTDVWGSSTSYLWQRAFTPAEINHANFGFMLTPTNSLSNEAVEVLVDKVEITVYYTPVTAEDAGGQTSCTGVLKRANVWYSDDSMEFSHRLTQSIGDVEPWLLTPGGCVDFCRNFPNCSSFFFEYKGGSTTRGQCQLYRVPSSQMPLYTPPNYYPVKYVYDLSGSCTMDPPTPVPSSEPCYPILTHKYAVPTGPNFGASQLNYTGAPYTATVDDCAVLCRAQPACRSFIFQLITNYTHGQCTTLSLHSWEATELLYLPGYFLYDMGGECIGFTTALPPPSTGLVTTGLATAATTGAAASCSYVLSRADTEAQMFSEGFLDFPSGEVTIETCLTMCRNYDDCASFQFTLSSDPVSPGLGSCVLWDKPGAQLSNVVASPGTNIYDTTGLCTVSPPVAVPSEAACYPVLSRLYRTADSADFALYLGSTTPGKTVSDCFDMCRADPLCRSFAYSEMGGPGGNGYCDFFSSPVANMTGRSSVRTSLYDTMGDCPVNMTCRARLVRSDVDGANTEFAYQLPGHSEPYKTLAECTEMCANYDDCLSFTFVPRWPAGYGQCRLWSRSASELNTQWWSGVNLYQLFGECNVTAPAVVNSSLACYAIRSRMYRTYSPEDDVANRLIEYPNNERMTVAECLGKCNSTANCRSFSWRQIYYPAPEPTGVCALFSVESSALVGVNDGNSNLYDVAGDCMGAATGILTSGTSSTGTTGTTSTGTTSTGTTGTTSTGTTSTGTTGTTSTGTTSTGTTSTGTTGTTSTGSTGTPSSGTTGSAAAGSTCTAVLQRSDVTGSESDYNNYWLTQSANDFTVADCLELCRNYKNCSSFEFRTADGSTGQCALYKVAASQLQGESFSGWRFYSLSGTCTPSQPVALESGAACYPVRTRMYSAMGPLDSSSKLHSNSNPATPKTPQECLTACQAISSCRSFAVTFSTPTAGQCAFYKVVTSGIIGMSLASRTHMYDLAGQCIGMTTAAGVSAGGDATTSAPAAETTAAETTAAETTAAAAGAVTTDIASTGFATTGWAPNLKTWNNRDFRGFDIQIVPNVHSPLTCGRLCTELSGCNAFTWHKWKRTCFLKEITVDADMEVNANGIAGVPCEDNSCYAFRAFAPADHRLRDISIVINVNSADECNVLCMDFTGPKRCNAFTYNAVRQKCFLKNIDELKSVMEKNPAGVVGIPCPNGICPTTASCKTYRKHRFIGNTIATVSNVKDHGRCSQACLANPACNAYTLDQLAQSCELKTIDGSAVMTPTGVRYQSGVKCSGLSC